MSSIPCSIKYNKTEISKLNRYLSILYKDLVKSSKYVNSLDIDINVNNPNNPNKPKFMNNKYFPTDIQQYIVKNTTQVVIFSATINGKNVILKFSNCNMPEYNLIVLTKHAKIAFTMIYMLSLYSSKKCVKNLIINIYLTPLKKMFPLNKDDIIGTDHVNGGFSNIGCLETSKITIYREEEWLKVLIHELFHNFSLDFATMNIEKWVPLLQRKFEIKSDFAIYETYCETWGRILNVAINSFAPTKAKFITNFNSLIKKERLYSLKQADLIIKRFNSPHAYREKSNVFCYYILTASLINNYLDFFLWCDENNTNLLKFKTTDKTVKSFIELLLTQVNSEEFTKSLKCVENYEKADKNSLRMTIT